MFTTAQHLLHLAVTELTGVSLSPCPRNSSASRYNQHQAILLFQAAALLLAHNHAAAHIILTTQLDQDLYPYIDAAACKCTSQV